MAKRAKEIDNLHIIGYEELPTPGALKNDFSLKGDALKTVKRGHRQVKSILNRDDMRLIVVVGPCSIHNPEEAIDDHPKSIDMDCDDILADADCDDENAAVLERSADADCDGALITRV